MLKTIVLSTLSTKIIVASLNYDPSLKIITFNNVEPKNLKCMQQNKDNNPCRQKKFIADIIGWKSVQHPIKKANRSHGTP